MCLILAVSVSAQELERVYVNTDRTCYVAGDDIYMSVFCFDAAGPENSISTLSSTVYVELQSSKATVQTTKVALSNGRGAGKMTIYPDLPTGNYALVAYTSQNAAEAGFVPYSRILTVFNVLSTAREEGGVEVSASPVGEGTFADDRKNTEALSIKNYAEYQELSEGILSIGNELDEGMSLSISVYHEDSLGTVRPAAIEDIAEGWKNMKGEIRDDYIPDYEGEVVRLKVSGDIPPGMLMSMTFPGKEPDLFFSRVDSSMTVTVYTGNLFGEKDLICQPYVSDTVVRNWNMELVDPFIRKPSADIPVLTIDPSMSSKVLSRGVAMQLYRRFRTDTLAEFISMRHKVGLMNPDKVYLLDDYTRFPLVTEILTEYVREMSVRKQSGKHIIRLWVLDIMNQAYFSEYKPMMMLDGMPVLNHEKILAYDPLLLKSIEIYSSENVYCGIPCGGIANFRTYKGDLSSWNFDSNSRIIRFNGVSLPGKFAYGDDAAGENPGMEYRQTLYWNPLVNIEAGENSTVRVKMPSYPGTFRICVEGVTASGKPVSASSSFKIR